MLVHILTYSFTFAIERIINGFAFYEQQTSRLENAMDISKYRLGSAVIKIVQRKMRINGIERRVIEGHFFADIALYDRQVIRAPFTREALQVFHIRLRNIECCYGTSEIEKMPGVFSPAAAEFQYGLRSVEIRATLLGKRISRNMRGRFFRPVGILIHHEYMIASGCDH